MKTRKIKNRKISRRSSVDLRKVFKEVGSEKERVLNRFCSNIIHSQFSIIINRNYIRIHNPIKRERKNKRKKMAYRQQRSKSAIDFQIPMHEYQNKRSSCSSLSSLKEEWKTQCEDESDWEILGILAGETTIANELFIKDGNEDVVLFQFIEEIPRCHAIFK